MSEYNRCDSYFIHTPQLAAKFFYLEKFLRMFYIISSYTTPIVLVIKCFALSHTDIVSVIKLLSANSFKSSAHYMPPFTGHALWDSY